MRLHNWILAVSLLAPVAGCDDGDDTDAGETDGSAGDGGGMQQGFTDCTPMGFEDNPTTCQPGQYCEDSNLASCEPGCLSNVNCAADQTCNIPSGDSVGACANNGPSGPTLDAFCMKLLTCDPSGTMEQCQTVYDGTNASCHQCIIDENCGDINDFDGACDNACGLG